MLLTLVPIERLPRLLRDLEYRVQMAAGFGVFILGLVLELSPLLVGRIVPSNLYWVTFGLAVLGIGLMIVGLLRAHRPQARSREGRSP